jgi:hypothetical protein
MLKGQKTIPNPASHRGGQGFESPQLHLKLQVRAVVVLACLSLKIICHRDVTRTERPEVTQVGPKRISRHPLAPAPTSFLE